MSRDEIKIKFNPVPVINEWHRDLVDYLRLETIGIMSSFYPDLYERFDGQLRYRKKGNIDKKGEKQPRLKGDPNELEFKLSKIYSEDVINELISLERMLRPEFENRGFHNILHYIRPSVMDSGPKSDAIKVLVQGTARCMDCFEEAVRYKRGSSGQGFFKLHDDGTERIPIATASVDELLENWGNLLPTDVRLAHDRSLVERITPKYCLAGKKPNHDHKKIVPLSTVIVLEYVDDNLERIRGSHVLHFRDKSGFEMARKMMSYFVGEKEHITDGIGSRSIVPDEMYAKVLVKTIRDYPHTTSLNGVISITNYTKEVLRNFIRKENLNGNEPSFLKHCIEAIDPSSYEGERKGIFVKFNGIERPAFDMRWIAGFGSGDSVMDGNVIQHIFYTDREYTAMNGYIGKNSDHSQDDMDYQRRRDTDARNWTLGHWIILGYLPIYDPNLSDYRGKIVDIRLKDARAYETSKRRQ